MKHLIKIILLSSILTTTAQANGIKCPLRQICHVPTHSDFLYIPVNTNISKQYKCVLTSRKSANFSANISGDDHFTFPEKNISVSSAHPVVQEIITGNFLSNSDGAIHIRNMNSDDTQASVFCTQNV